MNTTGTPTLVYVENDPVIDAAALRQAMRGLGTDEDGLINILCRRTNEQRQEIAKMYKTNFGKDLIENIKSETSGNFQKLLVALLTPTTMYYVKELHSAMSGLGTDENVLIETLCTMSNEEIEVIKEVYFETYGQTLENDLISDTSGHFRRLMVSLCNAHRDESDVTDIGKACADAQALLEAGEAKFGTDESVFNNIFCERNYQQLRLVIQQYQEYSGNSLENAVKSEFSGDIKDGLLAILQCVANPTEFFARRLHASMKGIGTNDKQLIRLVVTRCEIDMHDIKIEFARLFDDSLRNWIKGDTSGHYKHALYALLGEKRSS